MPMSKTQTEATQFAERKRQRGLVYRILYISIFGYGYQNLLAASKMTALCAYASPMMEILTSIKWNNNKNWVSFHRTVLVRYLYRPHVIPTRPSHTTHTHTLQEKKRDYIVVIQSPLIANGKRCVFVFTFVISFFLFVYPVCWKRKMGFS